MARSCVLLMLASVCLVGAMEIGPIGLEYAKEYRHRAFHLNGDSQYDRKPSKAEILMTLIDTIADKSDDNISKVRSTLMHDLQLARLRTEKPVSKKTTPAVTTQKPVDETVKSESIIKNHKNNPRLLSRKNQD